MTRGSLFRVCAWALSLLIAASGLGAVVPARKAHAGTAAAARGKTVAGANHPGGEAARLPKASRVLAKGKKGSALGTRRTVAVNPAVHEDAVARLERTLAGASGSAFEYPEALRAFFDSLAAEAAERTVVGAASATAPATFSRSVRVLQFGDSHTAADLFTGELRARMQQQFGDGGLGFQFPGHPFAGYHLAGSLRSQSGRWLTEGNRFTQLGDGDLGLGGLSISTSLAGETIGLTAACESLQLHFLRQPGGGRLQFTDNGVPIAVVDTGSGAPTRADGSIATGEAQSSAGTFSYACETGPHEFQFTTLDRAPVKLLGIVTDQPGVTWECLGINGAVAPLMLRWNQALFADYLRQRAPDLVVLAYGTNEAGSSAEHLESYPAELGQVLDTLHRTAGQASVLILGPEDRAMASGRGRRRSWHPLLGTSRIIAMQKAACRAHGCAFWDTRDRMGGLGSMPQWVAAGWGQPDRTHLTGPGYRALADALYADLIRAYNLYQQQRQAAASP